MDLNPFLRERLVGWRNGNVLLLVIFSLVSAYAVLLHKLNAEGVVFAQESIRLFFID